MKKRRLLKHTQPRFKSNMMNLMFRKFSMIMKNIFKTLSQTAKVRRRYVQVWAIPRSLSMRLKK